MKYLTFLLSIETKQIYIRIVFQNLDIYDSFSKNLKMKLCKEICKI